MQSGRRIAFDYGDVRIGVAVSDRDSILASPLTTLTNGDAKLFAKIQELITEYEPIAIYVGEPMNMSGDSSSSANKARDFADRLIAEFSIPVRMIDERLSTVSATKSLRLSGINAKSARNKVDMAAAVAILEQAIALEKAKDV
jgi:putative holliday junction resolvase